MAMAPRLLARPKRPSLEVLGVYVRWTPHPVIVTIRDTWTPKVCKIIAFMAIIMGLGLLFYILLGFR